MMTPQEIQEKTFAKAVFGGYDMQMVDEFVEPLAQDYITLYKENEVLKSKLKVLVKKLEEYREEEENRKKAEESAKATCDAMLQEAEKKCQEMLRDAENTAAQRGIGDLLAQEEHRLNCAKDLAMNFIDVLEQDIRGHLELLDTLRSRDLSKETQELKSALAAETRTAPAKESAVDHNEEARKIASEIEESLQRMGIATEDTQPIQPVSAPRPAQTTDAPTMKFHDLQFGKNYNPVGK